MLVKNYFSNLFVLLKISITFEADFLLFRNFFFLQPLNEQPPMEEFFNAFIEFLKKEKPGEFHSGYISDGFHSFDELYAYRMAYNAALFNEFALNGKYDAHKSLRHADGELCFGGGWFVVVAELPAGQITNHYPVKDWEHFRIPEREKAAEWDGHSPGVALQRLLDLGKEVGGD